MQTGGQGGIRTHGTLARSAVFKTAAFDHSATCPSLFGHSNLGNFINWKLPRNIFQLERLLRSYTHPPVLVYLVYNFQQSQKAKKLHDFYHYNRNSAGSKTLPKYTPNGGGSRIRTYVRKCGQIYSLLPLTARPSLHKVSKNYNFLTL